jgi:hypothetical protein
MHQIYIFFLFSFFIVSLSLQAENLPELRSVYWIDPGTQNAGIAWYESEDLGSGPDSGLRASLLIGTWMNLETSEIVDSFRNDFNGPEFKKKIEKEVYAEPNGDFQSRRLHFEISGGTMSPPAKKNRIVRKSKGPPMLS